MLTNVLQKVIKFNLAREKQIVPASSKPVVSGRSLDINSDPRLHILSALTRAYMTCVAKVLGRLQISAKLAMRYNFVAHRFIAINVRLVNTLDLPKAVAAVDSIGLAAGLGRGGRRTPLQVALNRHYVTYLFPLPEYHKQIRLWCNLSRSHPLIQGTSVIGIAPGQQKVTWDWDDEAPHTLVVGTTGAGKTELMKSIYMSIVEQYSPKEVQTAIVDLKGDFEIFDNEVHLQWPIARSGDEAEILIHNVWAERMRRRENRLRHEPRIILFIDEANRPETLRKNTVNQRKIQEIGEDGRTWLINLVLGSHDIKLDDIGPVAQSCVNRYLGRVDEANTSGTLRGGIDLHKLTGKGDFIWSRPNSSVRFLATLIDPNYVLEFHAEPLSELVPTVVEENLAATFETNPAHRPVIVAEPKYVAYWSYHGAVSEAQARVKLGLKKTGWQRNREWYLEMKKYYDILAECGGEYPKELDNE